MPLVTKDKYSPSGLKPDGFELYVDDCLAPADATLRNLIAFDYMFIVSHMLQILVPLSSLDLLSSICPHRYSSCNAVLGFASACVVNFQVTSGTRRCWACGLP